MVAAEAHGIIKNPAALDDASTDIPLRGRDAELRTLRSCLAPVARRIRPVQVWLAGPPGTGKTSLARTVLKELQSPHVLTVYVNCWECRTLHGILDAIVRDLRVLGGEKIDAQFKMERLRRFLRDKALLVVLDEVDRLTIAEREAVLYGLSELGTTGIVCISNSRSTYLELDARVRSRLSPQLVSLPSYTDVELLGIIAERATVALHRGTWQDDHLLRIVQFAHGDARVALRTLKLAAQLGDAARAPNLLMQHVEDGWAQVATLQRSYLLAKLGPHHERIYDAVRASPGSDIAAVREAYQRSCASDRAVPVARRTFYKYVAQLIQVGLLERSRTDTWPSIRHLRPTRRFLPERDAAS